MYVTRCMCWTQNILFSLRSFLSSTHKKETKIKSIQWFHTHICTRHTKWLSRRRFSVYMRVQCSLFTVQECFMIVCDMCMSANRRCDKVQRTLPSVSFHSYLVYMYIYINMFFFLSFYLSLYIVFPFCFRYSPPFHPLNYINTILGLMMIISLKWALETFASAPNDYAPRSTHKSHPTIAQTIVSKNRSQRR